MEIKEIQLKIKGLRENKYLLPVLIGVVIVVTVVIASFLVLQSSSSLNKVKQVNIPVKPTVTPYVQKIWTVMVTRDIFVPKTLIMKKGGTLNFLNVSQGGIDIESADETSQSTLLNIGVVPFGELKAVVMPTTGTYKYTNKLNPKEKGIIIVQ